MAIELYLLKDTAPLNNLYSSLVFYYESMHNGVEL
jgi:hypothetical protein